MSFPKKGNGRKGRRVNQRKSESMLGSFRVLDLTDEKGLLCGKLLGDLGADVIKIEPPCGDRARNIGPFYHDIPDPEKSLFWFAFNTNKRSITLDIETADGKEIFQRLVKTADLVVESFPPGYMDSLGLGYPVLSELNPRLVMTSITPFGQTGPYRDFKASDIVSIAMSGWMYLCGDPDRAPVRPVSPQAYVNAGAEAAAASMIALYNRERTGEGQYVDVSMQQSLIMTSFNSLPFWEMEHYILRRAGAFRVGFLQRARVRQTWQCRDGFISFTLFGGTVGAQTNRSLVEWMDSEGMANSFLRQMDWDNLDMTTVPQKTLNRIEKPMVKFFLAHTKAELFSGAIDRRIMLYPVSTPGEIRQSPQLEARNFWVPVEHPELADTITYPGAFVKAPEAPWQITRCPPLIGEHNSEIYQQELGFSQEDLTHLKQAKVI